MTKLRPCCILGLGMAKRYESSNARERSKHETGVVLIWSIICMGLLLLMAGFAVDVGNWYLQADRLQRAADAAALSGVSQMPDEAVAIATAQDTLSRNSIAQDANMQVKFTPLAPNRLTVEITNSNIPSIFIGAVMDHVSVKRSSTAEFRRAIPMGSPFNVIGGGSLDMSGALAGKPQGYWLAVNGWCTAKEDGDMLLSRYDGNHGSSGTFCPGSNDELNSDYSANGYDLIVDVRPHTAYGALQLRVWDGGFSPGIGSSADRTAPMANDHPVFVTTIYKIYDTHNSDELSAHELLKTVTFDQTMSKNCASQWCELFTLPDGGSTAEHKYRVNVSTAQGELDSAGLNAFTLEAWPQNLDGGKESCDARVTAACPEVYALNALSLLTDQSSGSAVEFYLASIETSYRGKALAISLWDPGEGANKVELLAPNGTARPFKWSASPNVTGDSYGGIADSIDVSGIGPQPPGGTRISQAKFNDRRLNIATVVPVDYENYLGPNGDTWWKVRYSMPTGTVPPDRTTWMAKIDDNSPVHLIRPTDQ